MIWTVFKLLMCSRHSSRSVERQMKSVRISNNVYKAQVIASESIDSHLHRECHFSTTVFTYVFLAKWSDTAYTDRDKLP